MKTNITKTTNSGLEIATCSRCGGSGQHSFCYSHGTRCFKCSGNGLVYTARGLATLNFLNALRSKPANEVKVGDKIKTSFGCPVTGERTAFCEVMSVGEEINCGTHYVVLNVASKDVSVTIHTFGILRVQQTEEQLAATLKQALEFQSTLTKSGKPAKRKA